jgi:hypothetical protein
MADYASSEWVQPRRWRRWVARFFAVVALAAAGTGVYLIVHEATKPGPPEPASLQPQVQTVAASAEALAVRLVALRPHGSPDAALRAVREAQGDRRAASLALTTKLADGEVAESKALGTALAAHRDYLAAVATVLRHPRSALARRLSVRARRAKDAWSALDAPAGLPHAIRGSRHVVAYARAHRSR